MPHIFINTTSAVINRTARIDLFQEIIENTQALRDGDQPLNQLTTADTLLSLTGTYNDYALSTSVHVMYIYGGYSSFTGLAGGRAGRQVLLCNLNADECVTLIHENGGSAASNRFFIHSSVSGFVSTPIQLVIPPGGVALLEYHATVPRWRAFLICHGRLNRVFLRNGSTQAIPDLGAFAAFSTEVYDVGHMHDPADNTKITIPPGGDGQYRFSASVDWPANATGLRGITLFNGASAQFTQYVAGFSVNTHGPTQVMSGDISVAAGDVLKLFAYQDAGGSLTIPLGAWFQVSQIIGQE